jgi:glycerophosphoryl diester phosphodiesterase
MFATAPGASIYYLEAKLILEAFRCGVDLIEPVRATGARVDAWTIDADYPGLNDALRRLIELGCNQITSNDPEQIAGIIDAIVA